jgi:altronate dehydratase small subunit
MVNGMFIDPKDCVVTLGGAVQPGDTVQYTDGGVTFEVTALDSIPVYHKMAVKAVPKGGRVIKYGELIGIASQDIVPGQHVHTHNIEEPERG